MILVDTSVWIDHLREGNLALAALLKHNQVVMHPMVLGELACGNLKNRPELLRLWQSLDSIQTANNEEALYFIEQHGLMGNGIGYIDVHLLASVILEAGTKLWTLDKRLARLATDLTCAWEEPSRE
ncbi:MAG TPA: type II toxin-antitoxin system VapC family toxin [Gammaproteobacteria bacterium]|nr:type II toxin-antitoxin system VapC family toxin [Gammaproteobacteria bacterium]